MDSEWPERLTVDSALGIGLNRIGALVYAPALVWSLQRPPAGAAAAFRGQVDAQCPEDQVGPILDRWAEFLGLIERDDHHGMRENVGTIDTANGLPVRVTVWGVTQRDQFEAGY
jgi:hypothetical protein